MQIFLHSPLAANPFPIATASASIASPIAIKSKSQKLIHAPPANTFIPLYRPSKTFLLDMEQFLI